MSTELTSQVPRRPEPPEIVFTPASAAEIQDGARRLRQAIEQIDADPTPEDPAGDAEFLRAIDSNRPDGYKLFVGLY